MAAAAARIPFNRDILRWARERRGLSISDAARSAYVTPNKVLEWEGGHSDPTVRQARLLAAAYGRPFLEFFSEAIPQLPSLQLIPDFRLGADAPGPIELLALEDLQEWAEAQRQNALDLYDMLGESPPSFPLELCADIQENPEEIASRVRERIGFSATLQLTMKSKEKRGFPTVLRQAFERIGILVLRQNDLSKTRTRGMCLYHSVLPTIIIGKEAPGGQVFTLAHELAHVILRQSAISGAPILAHKNGSFVRRVEGWCNAFAAAFLMPRRAIKNHPLVPSSFSQKISDLALRRLAAAFAVSRHAMLVRLVKLGLVDARYYWRTKRKDFLKEEANFDGGGRSEYFGSRYRGALGDLYTGLVIEAVNTGHLGYHSASEFMGIKNTRHFREIQAHFGS